MRIPSSAVMRLAIGIATLAGLVLWAGCATYRLGTESKPGFTSIFIPPVENKAHLPQAVAIMTTQVREAFLRDGRVTLANHAEDADAILQITLVRYGRDVATARPDDTGLGRKFNLALTALCTLRNTRDNSILFENRAIAVEQQIFATATPQQVDSDQLQAEYQALPLLAAALAEKVSHAALDVW